MKANKMSRDVAPFFITLCHTELSCQLQAITALPLWKEPVMPIS